MAVDPLPLDFGRAKRFCVYVYFDPRSRKREPIYVGKGLTETRPDFHWNSGSHNRSLNEILSQLREKGLAPDIEFVGFFDDGNQALACEIALIKKFGRRNIGTGPLCNSHETQTNAATQGSLAMKQVRKEDGLLIARPLWSKRSWTVAAISKESGLSKPTLYKELGPRRFEDEMSSSSLQLNEETK